MESRDNGILNNSILDGLELSKFTTNVDDLSSKEKINDDSLINTN